jgi:flagellin
MRINTAMLGASASQIGKNAGLLQKIHEKLATGKQINRASDDASGRAVAEELLTMTRGLSKGTSNIGDAMSALRIADGASGEISNMLQRQRELAIQASNDTLNDKDRGYLNKEYQALTEEIDRIANSSQFNRQSLLNGQSPLSDGSGYIHTGANKQDGVTLDAMNMTAASLGAGGSIGSAQDARTAIERTDRALGSVNEGRSTIGSRLNRFEHDANNNQNQAINTTEALSLIEDLDFAKGMMEKSRYDILSRSSTASAANFQEISRNNVMSLMA